MAGVDTPVSQFPAAGVLDGSELVALVQAGVSKKVPAGLIARLVTDNTRTAMAKAQALFNLRFTQAAPILCCGNSITDGTGSTSAAGRWISRFQDRMAAAYPVPAGATQGAVMYINNPGAGGTGIRIIGNGHGGATTETYLPAQEIIDAMKMKPVLVIHMIAVNDQAQGFTKARYKAALLAAVNAIRQQATSPVVQLIVREPELKRTGMAYPWSDYGDAMMEIVAGSPGDLAYVDLAPSFEQCQIRNGDPLGLMQPDGGHPTDLGHAFIADLLFAALYPKLSLGSATAVATSTTPVTPGFSTLGSPTISGTPTVGNTLTVVPGTWSPTPDSLSYQWTRAGSLIAGAVGTTYALVAADAGQPVGVRETATKSGYTTTTVTSPVVNVAAAAGSSSFTSAGTPTITGTPQVGSTLTAVPGSWTPAADSYLYQWNRAGSPITNATSSTYVPVTADIGQVTVTVSGVKSGYNPLPATSAAVTVAAAAGGGGSNLASDTFSGSGAWASPLWTVTGSGSSTQTSGQGVLATSTAGYTYELAFLTGMAAATDQTLTVDLVMPAANTVKIGLQSAQFDYSNVSVGYSLEIAVGAYAALYANGSFVGQQYKAFAAGAAIKVKFQKTGTTIQFKAWLASGSEPAAWDYSGADTKVTAAGRAWLAVVNAAAGTATSASFDNLVVA